MNTFVFLGPSLPLAQARSLCPQAHFLPPAAVGDIHGLVERYAQPGDVVALIDGVFEQVGAVWHKEILFALQRGVQVVGASSMGALRAAELDLYGMRGHGRIYEAFASGAMEDDDEVAVAHATAERGYRSLSLAMVSIRLRLQDLLAAGEMAAEPVEALMAELKSMPYAARCWPAVMAAAERRDLPAPVLARLRAVGAEPDAKASDAASLLLRLVRGDLPPQAAVVEPFHLEPTVFWQALVQHNALRGEAVQGDGDLRVLRQVRALHPDREALLNEAKLLRQAELWAAPSTPEQQRAAAVRVAEREGLRTNAELAAWRERQGLDDTQWRRLLDLLAREHTLAPTAQHLLDPYLLLAVRHRGQFEGVAQRVAQQQAHLQTLGLVKPTLEGLGLDLEAVCGWYERQHGPLPRDPAAQAHALGFAGLRDWMQEWALEAALQLEAQAV